MDCSSSQGHSTKSGVLSRHNTRKGQFKKNKKKSAISRHSKKTKSAKLKLYKKLPFEISKLSKGKLLCSYPKFKLFSFGCIFHRMIRKSTTTKHFRELRSPPHNSMIPQYIHSKLPQPFNHVPTSELQSINTEESPTANIKHCSTLYIQHYFWKVITHYSGSII